MNFKKLVRHFIARRFNALWHGKDLECFDEFLLAQAVPSGGFLLAFSALEQGGIIWFWYKVKAVQIKVKKQRIGISIEIPYVYIPEDQSSRELPEACKGYPVWRYAVSQAAR